MTLFSFLKRTLYNTWKSHYRRLQIPIITFNKNVVVNIYSISNSKNPPWNLLSFVLRVAINECLKNSARNCFLVLLWFRIIGKTIKTLGVYNNKHFFWSVKSRCFIQRRIQNPVKHLRWSVLRKSRFLITILSR